MQAVLGATPILSLASDLPAFTLLDDRMVTCCVYNWRRLDLAGGSMVLTKIGDADDIFGYIISGKCSKPGPFVCDDTHTHTHTHTPLSLSLSLSLSLFLCVCVYIACVACSLFSSSSYAPPSLSFSFYRCLLVPRFSFSFYCCLLISRVQ